MAQAPESWERPNRPWVCGRGLVGAACTEGPDPRGRCPVRAQCHPHRRGEGWQCARAAAWGGACDEGPLPDGACSRPLPPCTPRRSLRAQRGALGRWVVAFTAALFALALGSVGPEAVSPGPLSAEHQVVAAGCVGCHVSGLGWANGWTGHAGETQSQQCLACHDLGADALRIHGASLVDMSGRVARAAPATGDTPALLRLAALGPGHAMSPDGALACATCHPEHHGAQADLRSVSDLRCQTCHVARFRDLAHGHPDFSAYPYERRTRIVFDHSSHRDKHFPKRSAEFRCMGCHELDASGAGMSVPGFESGCASCHADDVNASALRPGQRGIVFYAGGDPDASPFLALLAAGEPPLAPAVLVSALAQEGQDALASRVAALRHGELPAGEGAALASGLPRELVLAPGKPAPAGRPADPTPEDWVARGGWFRQASDATLRYRPGGHADPFLHAWLDLAGELAGDPAPVAEPARALFADLTRPAAPGRCAYCHSVDERARPDGAPQLRANWSGRRARTREHGPTRFVHRPHLSLQDREGCTTCHRLDPDADYLAGFEQRDPRAQFTSGFRPMPRELCVTCHAGPSASGACTTCHRYHWGDFAPAFPGSPEAEPIDEPVMPAAPGAPAAPENPEAPAEDSDPDSLL